MRVLIIALLAAISYAQTGRRILSDATSGGPNTECTNPRLNIDIKESGCNQVTFCSFHTPAPPDSPVTGTCTACPDSCSTLPHAHWESFFACAAKCELPNSPDVPATVINTGKIIEDTSTTYSFAHPRITLCNTAASSNELSCGETPRPFHNGEYDDPCSYQQCHDGSCLVSSYSEMEGEACQFPYTLKGDTEATMVLGTCQLGLCVVDNKGDYDEACDHPQVPLKRVNSGQDCNSDTVSGNIAPFTGEECWSFGDNCILYGPGIRDFRTTVDHGNSGNDVLAQWQDEHGRCLIGEHFTDGQPCVITSGGLYDFQGLEIAYFQKATINGQVVSALSTPLLNVKLSVHVSCITSSSCHRVDFTAEHNGQKYCQHSFKYCGDPPATTHGDPIVWTFDEECYDLNKDGLYVASEAHMFDHTINIAVYNDYMREIQVIGRKNGEVMLSLNNLGEVINNNYPYFFSEQVKDCPPDMPKECPDTYTEFQFDAQDFRYYVQVVRHDYADPGLKEGDLGFHLDIYPKPYERGFQKHKKHYKGLYFENPLPEVLPYCPGGSPRAYRK